MSDNSGNNEEMTRKSTIQNDNLEREDAEDDEEERQEQQQQMNETVKDSTSQEIAPRTSVHTNQMESNGPRPLFGEAPKSIKSTDKLAGDNRVLRRIIAEDPDYNLTTIPTLAELCLKHCIENFEYNPYSTAYLNKRQMRRLLDSLSPDLPLKVTSHMIGEDSYWKRCCSANWPVVDLSRHGGSWKRAFFERMLEETIEKFVPGHTYAPRLEECVGYAAPYVHRLEIRQLLPPLKPQDRDKTSEDGSDAESDSDQPGEVFEQDHLDLGSVLNKLTNLEEIAISYTVKNCGMNFEWSIFQFTLKDCLNLSKAIQAHQNLRVLRLIRSRVDSDKCRLLVSHLLNHPTIECLDLSHNFIGDRGVRALSKLINGRSQIKALNLQNNRLQSTSGLALAYALTKPQCQLICLNLRLNRVEDDGGVALAKALLRNSTLKELNLAANNLNENAANYFAHTLAHNTTLTHLDLSNNQIGVAGTKKLQDGMERNTTLLYFDLRFTGSSQEAEYAISRRVETNQDNYRRNQQSQDQFAEYGQSPLNQITGVASMRQFTETFIDPCSF